YGADGNPVPVLFAPGNDPFVITVGAADINGTVGTQDDFAAPWSTYGYTVDGFAKPDLGAPGRYMIGPVPRYSSLLQERGSDLASQGYMQLSGTSFSAPVVAAAAALVLARHPSFTPDQVKGALMLTARPTRAANGALGVGELTANAAAAVASPPDPN